METASTMIWESTYIEQSCKLPPPWYEKSTYISHGNCLHYDMKSYKLEAIGTASTRVIETAT